MEDNSEVVDATTVQSNNDQSNSTSIPKHHVSFPNLTNDPDIKGDSEFLYKMQQIMTNGNTSKLFTPYLPQFRATYQKARRSVKKRIESKVTESQKLITIGKQVMVKIHCTHTLLRRIALWCSFSN